MSAWATAYCGICGLPMMGGTGSILRCPNAGNAAHSQWQTGNRVELYGNDAIDALRAEITALRAALDQERADNAKLRAFASDVLRNANDASPYLRQFLLGLLAEHGVTDDYGNPTALLSGRGEGGR